ncbi:MAG TPA: BMP family ABC transporter substrate-binding protein [Alphaproteobacteria bacterium]|nr:BMP family ABC transporter substrate-binding protein [Alphaproteobacteria bacterium]
MRHISRRDFLTYGAAGAVLATSRIARADDVLKVGVALVSPVAEVGWTKQHSLGVAAIKAALGDKVEINVIDNVFQPQDAERVFRGFATTGHRLIYGTSFSHGAPIARVAPQFPSVAFDSCAGSKVLANLGAFEAKYYEGAFIAGIASGKMSKTGKLGFIGGFPIPDIVGPANAILLGAQSVRPDATCNIIFLNSWSDPGKEKEAALALISQGCDVICSMTDSPAAVQAAEQNGVFSTGYASDMSKFGPTRQLTAFTVDWSSIYTQDAKDVIAGTWKPQNRWQGLKEGVVKMAPYAAIIPDDIRALLAKAETDIKSGALQPYGGEIKDQAGTVRVPKGGLLSDADVRGTNWLVAGMIGQMKG